MATAKDEFQENDLSEHPPRQARITHPEKKKSVRARTDLHSTRVRMRSAGSGSTRQRMMQRREYRRQEGSAACAAACSAGSLGLVFRGLQSQSLVGRPGARVEEHEREAECSRTLPVTTLQLSYLPLETADRSPRRGIHAAPLGSPSTREEGEERGAVGRREREREREGRKNNGEWGTLGLRVDFIRFQGLSPGGVK